MENATDHQQIDSPWQSAFKTGKEAAWQNRWPGLCLWLLGVAIIAGYFNIDSIREIFETVGRWKNEIGIIFGIVSTAIFGGLLPAILPLLFGKSAPKFFWTLLISNVLFWGLKGFEVDMLYRFQAWMFGDSNDFQTVAIKVAFDLLIYAPFFGLTNCVLFYIWRDNGFSFARTKSSLGENWFVRKIMPALISNWCVWLPSVIMIYNLPLALQLPVQNLILCFWVLVLVFFTTEDEVLDA